MYMENRNKSSLVHDFYIIEGSQHVQPIEVHALILKHKKEKLCPLNIVFKNLVGAKVSFPSNSAARANEVF